MDNLGLGLQSGAKPLQCQQCHSHYVITFISFLPRLCVCVCDKEQVKYYMIIKVPLSPPLRPPSFFLLSLCQT